VAVESSAVQIVVNVTDANSGPVIAGVTQNIKKLGAAGSRSGKQVKQGMEEMGAGALSAHQKVHLLSEEFGVHIPRAMQGVIAKSPAVMGVINGLGTAMVALGAIQIGGMVFEGLTHGAEKAWDALTALPKAVQEYQAEVEKTKSEDFGNTHSIETTRLRIDESTEAIKRFQAQAEETMAQSIGWRTIAGDMLLPGVGGNAWQKNHEKDEAASQIAALQKQRDKLEHINESEQYHEERERNIGLDHAGDARLKDPQAKHNAAIQEAKDRAFEDKRYSKEREGMLGNSVAPNAGDSEEKDKVASATIKADAELANAQDAKAERGKQHASEAKMQAQELRRIHEQALESGLRGSALYHAQEAAAIEDLKHKGIASAQAVNDVHTKYHNEEMNRLRDQQAETARMGREAAQAGMTGIQKTQREGENRVAEINATPDLDPAQRAQRIVYANRMTNAEIAEQEQALALRVNALADESATHQISGYARIEAEAKKHFDTIRAEIEHTYGKAPLIGPPSLMQAKGTAETNRAQDISTTSVNSQEKDYGQKMAEETTQIEEQARVKSLSSERQKTASIAAEYQERFSKYEEWKRQELSAATLTAEQIASITENANRREAAAAQEANAEMVEAATEARKKMAGEFDSFFKGMDHPLKYLQEMGDKVAGEAAAGLVQHFQQRGQGEAGTSQKSGLMHDMFGDFGFHGKNKTVGAGENAPALAGAHGSHGAGEKTIGISQATIHIGSANFAGMGAGAGSGTGTGSSWSSSGGSTGLLTQGASGASGGVGDIGAAAPGSPAWSRAGATSSGASLPGASTAEPGGNSSASSQKGGAFSNILGDFGFHRKSKVAGAGENAPNWAAPGVQLLSMPGVPVPGASQGSSSSRTNAEQPGGNSSAAASAIGGAGAGGGASAVPDYTVGSGSSPAQKNIVDSTIKNSEQGYSLYKQGKGIFGNGSSSSSGDAGQGSGPKQQLPLGVKKDQYAETQDDPLEGKLNSDGSYTSSSRPTGMLNGGGVTEDNVTGAAQGAVGLYSAYQGNGGVGGAMSGAMSGMEFGMAVGGPVGAAIGAVGGAVLGAIGFGGREKMRVYDLKTVRPRLANDRDSYQQGSMDYMTAYADAESLQTEADKTSKSYGPAAGSYFSDTIKPEIKEAEGKLTAEQRAGRSMYTAQAAQYDWGGPVDNFGTLGTTPGHGFIHAQQGEYVVEQQQALTHSTALTAINAGASHADMANLYGAKQGTMPTQPASMGDVHLHVHAIDAKGVAGFLDKYKHNIRSAVNDSYAENSGGGMN